MKYFPFSHTIRDAKKRNFRFVLLKFIFCFMATSRIAHD